MVFAFPVLQAPLSVTTRMGDSEALDPPGVRETLSRAQLGDRAALADLYGRYRDDVDRLCGRLLGSRSDAEDAHSEVFLRTQTALASYDPKRPFRRWLLGIASHHCIDRLRRRQVEGRLFSADDLDPDARPGRGLSPLAAALGEEQRRRLSAAVDSLEDRYRAPLVLRYFAELSYREIAEQLELRPEQVGVLLQRAKDRLRRQLGRSGGRP